MVCQAHAHTHLPKTHVLLEGGGEESFTNKNLFTQYNSFFVVFQIYYYHNVKCRREMFDKDIIMLQVMN